MGCKHTVNQNENGGKVFAMFWVGLTVLEPLDYGTEVLGSSPFLSLFGAINKFVLNSCDVQDSSVHTKLHQ